MGSGIVQLLFHFVLPVNNNDDVKDLPLILFQSFFFEIEL